MAKNTKFYSWREGFQYLDEVAPTETGDEVTAADRMNVKPQKPKKEKEESKEVTEKKVNNKVKMNPTYAEEVFSELGGVIVEMYQLDEETEILESVYQELLDEGYTEDEIEEAIENELNEDYYASAVKTSQKNANKLKRQEFKKKVQGRLKFMKRKAGEAVSSAVSSAKEKASSAKKKVGMASAKAQVGAYNKGREVAQTLGDKTRKAKQTFGRAKDAIKNAPSNAKKSLKSKIASGAQRVANRFAEEVQEKKKI